MTFALALFTLFGHAFLWIGLVNRLHAILIPRWIIDWLTVFAFAMIAAGPVAFFAWGWRGGEISSSRMFLAYFAICWIAGACTLARWLWHNFHLRRPPKLLRLHRRRQADISLDEAVINPTDNVHHFTVRLPGNQSLQLEAVERNFVVPRLPSALDGLKILHLSDLHFTGNVGKAYFREVVRIGNELQPDLIAITGDFADRNDCLDWIPDTLGQLAAPCGVYYVLGNHDTYIDAKRLREVLDASGLIPLSGRWLQLPIRGESVILAGNELPWIAPAADFSRCPAASTQGGPVRIVLSHTPDQIDWARAHEADLMLCGHTHGGQIRLPLVGAIFMPSAHGVKFDCGLFHLPPTILHVTRGISGKHSLRWNCPPEIVLLTLHSPIVS